MSKNLENEISYNVEHQKLLGPTSGFLIRALINNLVGVSSQEEGEFTVVIATDGQVTTNSIVKTPLSEKSNFSTEWVVTPTLSPVSFVTIHFYRLERWQTMRKISREELET